MQLRKLWTYFIYTNYRGGIEKQQIHIVLLAHLSVPVACPCVCTIPGRFFIVSQFS